MKKTLFFLLISLSVFAQKTTEKFRSELLDASREITIVLPKSYSESKTKKYPLIILLNGEYLLPAFEGALSYGNYWDDLPEVIMVAINQQSQENSAEEQTVMDCEYDPADGLLTKRSTAFYECIGNELVPQLEKKFRTSSFRIIAGNDLAGGFVNYYLYNKKSYFNAYISMGADLAPLMERYVPENLSSIQKIIYYYQSISDGTIKKKKEPVDILANNISTIEQKLLKYKFEEFKNTNPYSFVLKSIPSALIHIFDVYSPISSSDYTNEILPLPNRQTQYLIDKYKEIEDILGVKKTVRLNDFKAIEAAIIKKENYDELDNLAQLADKNYPDSTLPYYYEGLMYEKKKDFKKAFLKYQKGYQAKKEAGEVNKDLMSAKYQAMKALTPTK
jgi:predicted alpha/beta superfamily hydrolase